MNLSEKRLFLINELLNEQNLQDTVAIPKDEKGQRVLLRALFNIRNPLPTSDEFLQVQNEYLQEILAQKDVIDIANLTPIEHDIYLYKGDITTLKCDAIVNAANSQMLGCFCPNHSCIDNQIHTFAGVQLRLACNEIMKKQGFLEPTGVRKSRLLSTCVANLFCTQSVQLLPRMLTKKPKNKSHLAILRA